METITVPVLWSCWGDYIKTLAQFLAHYKHNKTWMLVWIKGPGAIFYQWSCTTEFWSDFQEESPKLYVNVSIPVHWLSHLFIEMPQEVHLLHQVVHCAMQIHSAYVCGIYILGEKERKKGSGLSPRDSCPSPSQPSTLAGKDHLPPLPATLLTFLRTTNSFSAAVRLLISSSYLLNKEDSTQFTF